MTRGKPRARSSPSTGDDDFDYVVSRRRRRRAAEGDRYRVRFSEVRARNRFYFAPGLVAELAERPGWIIAADHDRLRRPLCVPVRGPHCQAHACLGIGGEHGGPLIAGVGQDLPRLRFHHPPGFRLPLRTVQPEDSVRVLLADDALLSRRGPGRDGEQSQKNGGEGPEHSGATLRCRQRYQCSILRWSGSRKFTENVMPRIRFLRATYFVPSLYSCQLAHAMRRVYQLFQTRAAGPG